MSKPKNIDEYLTDKEGTAYYDLLVRIRKIILSTAPEIEEKIKWGAPSFEYKGLLAGMLAFKSHAAVWFHKGALLDDPQNLLETSAETTKSMRKYMLRSVDDLNEEGLRDLLKQAIQKNEDGEEVEGLGKASRAHEKCELLDEALALEPEVKKTFDNLSPYKQKEYNEYIHTAKQEATKQKRLAKSLELLREGRGLHDMYRK